MTTQEVANRLVELCREGNYDQAIKELYAPDIVSVEPEGTPNRIVKGLEAIAKKGEQFQSMLEKVNSNVVSDPVVAENFFSCAMLLNVNMKGVPVPVDMHEICVYTVNNGKVVREEFFHTPQKQEA
ncbi:nuclear transport factor 2 family protein [Aureispira anguillae]|uniref:Nuclear transport factor 2 family protein n=1 Tax=Aureispira anguillae TaxID=2864201 RepID=A0A915YAE1_9BACT|nr:nuclear transport factor 2 family protein [Aureispira anguillae]BDS09497.1 nuclear transport factor 2 family protein [Aureispira anguillae]